MASDDNDGPVLIADDDTSYTLVAAESVDAQGHAAAITTKGLGDTISIGGTVDGGFGAGILVSTGPKTINPDPYAGASPIYYFYDDGSAAITIDAGASITGAVGIRAEVPIEDLDYAHDHGGSAVVSLDNHGRITGTDFSAVAAAGLGASFSTITNETDGYIGGVSGLVGTLTNEGMIAGGSRAALDVVTGHAIDNRGTITSSGDIATVLGASIILNNSGSIEATGGARAIDGYYVGITNSAGGTISAALGNDAIRAGGGGITLNNSGVINGNLSVAGSYSEDHIDQSGGGVINGDVLLGDAPDTLTARLDGDGHLVTGVTGILDGGDGIDTIILDVDRDSAATISALPSGFENLEFDFKRARTATFDGSTTDIELVGTGQLVNNGTVASSGSSAIFGNFIIDYAKLEIVNNGTISATGLSYDGGFDNQAAIDFTGENGFGTHVEAFTNNGTVISDGGGAVSLGGGAGRYARFENSGLIHSSNDTGATAVIAALTGTKANSFLNTGDIISDDGTAVALSGTYGATQSAENDGTIHGREAGAVVQNIDFLNRGVITAAPNDDDYHAAVMQIDDSLENRGKIAAESMAVHLINSSLNNSGLVQSYDGTAVQLGSAISVDNEVDGRIKGVIAITSANPYHSQPDFTLHNEGRIYGTIDLRSGYSDGGGDTIDNSGYIKGVVMMSTGDDTFAGGSGTINGALFGGAGNDVLTVGAGSNELHGDDGDDVLDGGRGADVLTGGAGADRFLFLAGDTGLKAYSADRITDFSTSEGDKIDLSGVTVSAAGTTHGLSFIGSQAFDGGAGELRYYTHANQTFIEADLNGDGRRDLMITLDGVHQLSTADFVL